jgi:multidrug efflux system membrane fusion protein
MIHSPTSTSVPSTAAQPRRRGSARTVLLVVAALVLVGIVVWVVRSRSSAAAATAASAAKMASDRVVPVIAAPVVRRDVPVWLDGLGNVSAFYTVTVKPQVDGRIDNVAFVEGQHVKKGDLLVQIDPRAFAIQLESAQANLARDRANLNNAKLNADRYRILSSQNLISTQQLTDQQSSVAQLTAQIGSDQAQVDTARLNLDYARITSPIDGVVGVRIVDPGNVVHASDPGGLVVVTQLDPIAVFFILPEDDLPAVSKAMAQGPLTVEVRSRDGDKPLGEGTLAVVDNQINQATATIRLKAIFANPQRLLWPNQFVKARLRLATRSDSLVVPAAVVQHGPQGMFVYVIGTDSAASVRPIAIDSIQGDLAIVTSGLHEGEQVVVDGQAQLRPGSKVAPRPAAATSASARVEAKP